jgi:hypothetical protein
VATTLVGIGVSLIWKTSQTTANVPGLPDEGQRRAMTEKNTSAEKLAGDGRRTIKKPYVKPEFRYERAFETMALACGKIRATQTLCRFNRKNS